MTLITDKDVGRKCIVVNEFQPRIGVITSVGHSTKHYLGRVNVSYTNSLGFCYASQDCVYFEKEPAIKQFKGMMDLCAEQIDAISKMDLNQ